jgi:hypothetical protein
MIQLKKIGVALQVIALVVLGVTSCEMDADPEFSSYTELYLSVENLSDSAHYRVMLNNYSIDTIGMGAGYGGYYRYNSSLSPINFKVFKLGKEEDTLQIDTLISPNGDYEIFLIQTGAGKPLQIFENLQPADSTQVNVQLFYQEDNQPDQVKVDIMAVDGYSYIMNFEELEECPDSVKTIINTLTLKRNQLSPVVTFDLNYYSEINNNMAALFFYRVSDTKTGNIIQDYDTENGAIDIETSSDMYPTYKTSVMIWGYTSAKTLFSSPEILIYGDTWLE